jgi:hypothetical protein
VVNIAANIPQSSSATAWQPIIFFIASEVVSRNLISIGILKKTKLIVRVWRFMCYTRFMKVKFENTTKYKIQKRLDKLPSNVVLRKDFADLGNYRQISRGLQQLVLDKKLVKIGSGLYAKSYFTDKVAAFIDRPLIVGGSEYAFREALRRLNVKWDMNWAEKENLAGKSTQLPAAIMVRLKSRCRRKIVYGNRKLLFEGSINAR